MARTAGNDPPEVRACPGCDLLQRVPSLAPGAKARCARCAEPLANRPPGSLDRALALTLAASIVFIIANTQPLMGLSALGHYASTTIIGGAFQMWLQGREATAALVAFCAVIAPLIYILFLLGVLLCLRRSPVPQWVGRLLRWADILRPWSMLEVMLLGILVALTKIAELATVVPGIGMYAVGVLVVLFTAIPATLNPREVWTRVEWMRGGVASRTPGVASGNGPT
jgi:paraquat-inducible protein A